MIKKISAIILALLLCITPVLATRIPTQDSSIYVNDYAEVFSDETKQTLISLNTSSDHQTGGYVVVATFDFVDEDLYDFSYRLFNQWGIGDEENDNGILLVLDIGNDNYSYILGTGIEKILSDSQARTIIDNYMETDFAKKDYDNAVLKTTKQFLKVIENGDFQVSDNPSNNHGFLNFNIMEMIKIGTIILIIIIVVIASAILPRRRRVYRPRRGYHMPPPPPPHMGGPRPGPRPRPRSRPMSGGSRPSGGFRTGGSGGTHHSGGSSRGAGGTRK